MHFTRITTFAVVVALLGTTTVLVSGMPKGGDDLSKAIDKTSDLAEVVQAIKDETDKDLVNQYANGKSHFSAETNKKIVQWTIGGLAGAGTSAKSS